MPKVRMLQQVSGTLNDVPYPPAGSPFEVSDEVAEKMYANGSAQAWSDKPDEVENSYVPTAADRRGIGSGGDNPHTPGAHVTEALIVDPPDGRNRDGTPAESDEEKAARKKSGDAPVADATTSPVAPAKAAPTKAVK